MRARLAAVVLSVLFASACGPWFAAAAGDLLPEHGNVAVTALVEDSESVRLALGAAWDDALACRALAGYLPAAERGEFPAQAEQTVAKGARLYERVKCVDDGIGSVRLARDTRVLPFEPDLAFWRNELAFAAADVVAYGWETQALRAQLEQKLRAFAAAAGLSAKVVPGSPWADPQREAWRLAGPAAGVRLPLEPLPESYAQWWNTNLSVTPGYLVRKFRAAGERFFSSERPVGAWGIACTGPGRYDWTRLNGVVRLLRDRQAQFLLELPTLTPHKSESEVAEEPRQFKQRQWSTWPLYAPALPAHLAEDPAASLAARQEDGTLRPSGAVQLFNPEVAAAYGAYLKAMAANLRAEGLYESVAAVHLEQGDTAELPETVDYSDVTRARWQRFLAGRYKNDIAALNRAASTAHADFAAVDIPVRALDERAAADWAAFAESAKSRDANAWGRYLQGKYQSPDGIRAALGDDYKDGYGWRLPFHYPPVLGIDYLHFRRQWVRDYLELKRGLVAAAFPDKLIIAEMRQFGDHDGVQGLAEKKWGAFLDEDNAQWTGLGVGYEAQPFMLRSVEPVGFGTRLSDSLESLYREYLWLNFREPGNLARYFYHWVAHGYLDYQLGWHSVTNHWLTNQLLYACGATVANTVPAPQRIGLLLPRAGYDLADGPVYYSAMGWDWALGSAKLPYTRVDEDVIRAGRLPELGLDVLILPGSATGLDDTVAAALRKWVEAGGTLVADGIPGTTDEHGRARPRPALADVLGVEADGTVTEPVKDTPLGVTVPHGHYSGRWQETSERRPPFLALAPTPDAGEPGSSRPQAPAVVGGPDKPGPPAAPPGPAVTVLARYAGGKPAITRHAFGKGRAVTFGYPFGAETVECERTSIGFQRTYVWFVREPQLVARVQWLREFLIGTLRFHPDYGVEYAEVQRFEGVEEIAPGFHTPKGLAEDPSDPFFVRTVGDPRPGHEMRLKREAPDLALRFFPRRRDGLATQYLGVSTREVHYLGPRATVQMILARHAYRGRINNPRICALWDAVRDVPIAFERDAGGIAFDLSLPSGHIALLAWSETPQVELFAPAAFPGRGKADAQERCLSLAKRATRRFFAATKPPPVAVLTPPAELRAWAQELATPPDPKAPEKKEPVRISYGCPENRPAAEALAAFLRERYGLDAQPVEQLLQKPADWTASLGREYQQALVLIGDEWTNNDLGMHGAYWGIAYGAHLPFSATYAWPGPGRAVVALSRAYALTDENGGVPFVFHDGIRLRPVQRAWPLLRRKLYIAGNGRDAEAAVAAVVKAMEASE